MPDQVIERMRRDMRDHSRAAVRFVHAEAYASATAGRGGLHIPVRTGTTLASATPWKGRHKIAKVPLGLYAPRGRHSAYSVSRSYRHGDTLGVSAQHPGGLLARGGRVQSGPRAGQLFSRKNPRGFHATMDEHTRRAFARWRWRRGQQ